METPHEALDTLKQIRSKLDEARTLSRSLGNPETSHDLEATLNTLIMGLDAQAEALKNVDEPHGAQ